MRRPSVLLAIAAVLMLGLASCSTASTSTPSGSSAPGGADTGTAKVDAYCSQVQDLVDKANQLKATHDAALSKEVSQEAKELVQQAVALVGAVASNPGLAARVSQCSSDAAGVARDAG